MSERTDPLRSSIMRSVPQKNTKPEMVVRRALHKDGYRFRVNFSELPGSPDIAFTKKRKAIFVHGCFWHRHEGCRRATTPKTRVDFWTKKFQSNIERDARKSNELLDLGWEVMTIWECEVSDLNSLMKKLRTFLG